MSNDKNLTIFQKLNKTFGKEGVTVPHKDTKKYSVDSKELLRTTSKQEYETAKAQALQNKFLGNTWQRVENELFQQSIHYETTRIGSYSDFEAMEYYPTIAAALDIFMEESTTTNDKGKIMNIYSDSTRVRDILNDLFFNRLDIHTSLPMWTRNMVKLGDNFILLHLDDRKGVIGARQLPNYEIERREGDFADSILNKNNLGKTDNQSLNSGDGEQKIKFVWKGRNLVFNPWQIAHFRLLTDDRKIPYGVSVLEKARRIWKLCIMAEDSMLAYRVERGPERRVFKIFVEKLCSLNEL